MKSISLISYWLLNGILFSIQNKAPFIFSLILQLFNYTTVFSLESRHIDRNSYLLWNPKKQVECISFVYSKYYPKCLYIKQNFHLVFKSEFIFPCSPLAEIVSSLYTYRVILINDRR